MVGAVLNIQQVVVCVMSHTLEITASTNIALMTVVETKVYVTSQLVNVFVMLYTIHTTSQGAWKARTGMQLTKVLTVHT